MLKSLASRIKSFLPQRIKVEYDIGTSIPDPPIVSRTDISDVRGRRDLEQQVKDFAGKARENFGHLKIAPERISVSIAVPGYGSYGFNLEYNNPVLKRGEKYLFWGFPDIHEREFRKAFYTSDRNEKKLKEKNIEAFKTIVTKYLRAAYQDKKVNWEEEMENTVFIKLGERIVSRGNEKEATVFVDGYDIFEKEKTVSEIMKENSIEAKTEDRRERKFLAVSHFAEKYKSSKTVIILAKDKTKNGENALNLAERLGLKECYKIFDFPSVEYVRALVDDGVLKKKGKINRIAASGLALLLAGGIGYGIGYNAVDDRPAKEITQKYDVQEEPAKPKPEPARYEPKLAKTPTKKAPKKITVPRKPVQSRSAAKINHAVPDNPLLDLSSAYLKDKKKVKITANASDSDGIEKLVGEVRGAFGMKVKIWNKDYKNKKKVSEVYENDVYEDNVSAGFWQKGVRYTIMIEAIDAKKNKTKKTYSLEIPD